MATAPTFQQLRTIVPPVPGMTRQAYVPVAFKWGTDLVLWSNDVNSLSVQYGQVYVNTAAQADTAAAAAAAANNSAAAAANSATTAQQLAGTTPWVSGKTYAVGDAVRSLLNGRLYARKTAGAGTIDPANDATNWLETLPSLQSINRANFTALASNTTTYVKPGSYLVETYFGSSTVYLPPSSETAPGDAIILYCVDNRWSKNKMKVMVQGKNNINEKALVDGDSIEFTGGFCKVEFVCDANTGAINYWSMTP